MAKTSPQQIATLAFDESGTPIKGTGGDRHFVVAGFVVRGDADVLKREWTSWKASHTAPAKGGKYTSAQLESFADFVIEHKVLPITSTSIVTEAEEERLGRRLDELTPALSERGEKALAAGPYIWTHQVAETIVPGLLGSAATYGGQIREIRLSVSEFSLPAMLKRVLEKVVSRNLENPHAALKNAIERHELEERNLHVLLGRNLNKKPSLVIEWDANSGLTEIADVMSVLFRKAASGDVDAAPLRDRVVAHFRTPERPLVCIDMDHTSFIRDTVVDRPWPVTDPK